jgi:hypothetical protein
LTLKFVGLEQIENRKIFVVEYNQTKSTLLLKANPTDEELKKEPEGRQYNSLVTRRFSSNQYAAGRENLA